MSTTHNAVEFTPWPTPAQAHGELGSFVALAMRKKTLRKGNGPTDIDRQLAHDPAFGFFRDAEGNTYPSAGALRWGLSEIERVTGPDAVGIVLQVNRPKDRT